MSIYKSVWESPEIRLRLAELEVQGLSNSKIAELLSAIFHQPISKNAVVGYRRRARLRQEQAKPPPVSWTAFNTLRS